MYRLVGISQDKSGCSSIWEGPAYSSLIGLSCYELKKNYANKIMDENPMISEFEVNLVEI